MLISLSFSRFLCFFFYYDCGKLNYERREIILLGCEQCSNWGRDVPEDRAPSFFKNILVLPW